MSICASARITGRALGIRLLLVLLGSAVAIVAVAGPASAHNVLTGTTPASGATVSKTPGVVVLTFAEPAIAMGTQMVVTGPGGPAQQGAPRLVDNTVSQNLQGGAPAGNYRVAWRVTSADGHPVSGAFTFTTRTAGSGQPPTARVTASAAPGAGATRRVGTIWVWGGAGLLVAATATAAGVARLRRRREADDAPTGRP